MCCPVCRAREGQSHFCQAGELAYLACAVCSARYLDPMFRPSAEAERAQYLLHENDPSDLRYRAFLARLATPLLERLAPGQHGLDYGCGPGPTLSLMLEEAGHRMTVYDPFFCPDAQVLTRQYDFVTCTEVAEHFHDPAAEFDRLAGLILPGGWLAVMTCFQTDDKRFANWHYRTDPTHVVFYREATFHWLARALGWCCEIPRKDVALLKKPA